LSQFKHDYPKADNLQKKLTKVRAEIKRLINAIQAGVPREALRYEMQAPENQRTEIESKLEEEPVATARLHPNLPTIY
jgi:hypothetical protein